MPDVTVAHAPRLTPDGHAAPSGAYDGRELDLPSSDDEVLDRLADLGFSPLTQRLDPERVAVLRAAVARVREREGHGDGAEALHILSLFELDPVFVDLVDWPPMLGPVTTALSPNIHIHHSHLDVHPPGSSTVPGGWHRDGGVQGRDMRLLPARQPRLAVKAAVFLTDVDRPGDGAFELVPCSHRDDGLPERTTEPTTIQPLALPAGTIALFDTRCLHRRGANTRDRTREAVFFTYTYRWITSRDDLYEHHPEFHALSPLRRQLLCDPTWEPFYPKPGALPLDAWVAETAG